MRYCPRCRTPYEDWARECSDCGVALVAELPATSPDERPARLRRDEPLVRVAVLPNEPLALMAQRMLEEAGIRSLLRAGGPGVGGWASNATFEHELFVLESDARAARALLTGEAEPFEEDSDADQRP